MADSNITKKALASALKELMEEKAFEKISVGDICDKCNMNRKSFYYHFKDKYHLVNWIFDTEFITTAQKKQYKNPWDILLMISQFFYDNRPFYRKALCIKGQNSFTEHFRDFLYPIIAERLRDIINEKDQEFQITFIADAIVMAFQRWIVDNSMMTPEEFVNQIKLSVKYLSISYIEDENKSPF